MHACLTHVEVCLAVVSGSGLQVCEQGMVGLCVVDGWVVCHRRCVDRLLRGKSGHAGSIVIEKSLLSILRINC